MLAWAGAAAVLWLWWRNAPAVAATTADRLVNAAGTARRWPGCGRAPAWGRRAGPYGAMTAARRGRGKVLLLVGGAGITPLRALFETLPAAPGHLTLLHRARTAEELALREELEAIADERGAQLLYAVNSPDGRRPAIPATMLRKGGDFAGRGDVLVR